VDGAAIFSDMDALVVAARELHLIERPHADLDLDLLAVVIHRDAWAAAWQTVATQHHVGKAVNWVREKL
jgi:P2-related tail formation protein